MIPDGRYVAVVDRFEGELVALVVEREDETDELVVPHQAVPAEARQQDAVLEITVAGGELVDATYQPEETERRRDDAQRRFDRLSKRPDEDT